jgi:hypothetical protein
MTTEETQKKEGVGFGPEAVVENQPAKAASPQKIEANRRNAQRSTGPKTPEGKAKSSQNSITHGIFAKQFLNGAAPETVAEMEVLAVGIQEHYQPVGMVEEILVQKIVVETARYGRILGLEQKELARNFAFFNAAVDRMGRYTTSTSRGLFRTIEELERIQAARKARETAAASAATGSSARAGVSPGTVRERRRRTRPLRAGSGRRKVNLQNEATEFVRGSKATKPILADKLFRVSACHTAQPS